VTLQDGTHLVLGPASRLRVPADFGVRDRTVDLDGEGYFTVVHDVAHPFAVRTARATVRDVGTTFSVRDYADDREERVAVAEGEVAIGAVAVRARDIATVDSIGQVRVQASGDVALELAWTQGGLAFQRTPLVAVVRDVARTFGLRITIADTALGNQLITAAFGSQSADEVLDEITHLVGAEYTRDGTRVVIRRRAGGADWRRAPSSEPLQTARTADVQE
jgi:ferric-dicitrate binding protein FerR (iron transport regulator)